jgi:predicted ArsR family transcriptional regulator
VDIHYHIRKLLADGSIIVGEIQPANGQGRPARRFELVETPPLSLTRAVMSLFLSSPDHSSTGIITQAEHIASRILDCCPSAKDTALSPVVRLNRIVEELRTLGFVLTWQAGNKGPLIQLHHEPISLLIEDRDLAHEIVHTLIEQIRNKTA